MADRGPAGEESESIGDLVGRLVQDGRDYAQAEFEVYRAIVEHRADRARRSMVALAVGSFLMIAALSALTIGAMIALSLTIGPLLAGVMLGLPMALIGYLFVRYGWRGVRSLGSDEPERDAIIRGRESA